MMNIPETTYHQQSRGLGLGHRIVTTDVIHRNHFPKTFIESIKVVGFASFLHPPS